MAQEVLIEYATRSIDVALRKLSQTKKLADEAARKIGNALERRKQLKANRSDYLSKRAVLVEEKRAGSARDALEVRAEALRKRRAQDAGGLDARGLGGALNNAREVIGAAGSLNVASLATKAGPIGALAAAVYAAVIKPLQDEADRRFERWRLETEANTRAYLDERFRSFEDRLKSDPVFRQQQAAIGAAEARDRGEAQYKHGRSAALAGL